VEVGYSPARLSESDGCRCAVADESGHRYASSVHERAASSCELREGDFGRVDKVELECTVGEQCMGG
jgi:hypothetical protein